MDRESSGRRPVRRIFFILPGGLGDSRTVRGNIRRRTTPVRWKMTLRGETAAGGDAPPASLKRGRRPGRGGGAASYFLPMLTEAVPAGETQPAAEISVTESVTVPLLPAVKVIRLVPWPAVIVPFEMLQS